MKITEKINQLKRLLDDDATAAVNGDSDDPAFKAWKNTVERTLIRVFGKDSTELEHFHQLNFFYVQSIMSLEADYSAEHLDCFDRDCKTLFSSIGNYIGELQQDDDDDASEPDAATQRIFISHSSKDAAFVEDVVDLLELFGLPGESIFCTSFAGYGIGLGENFLDSIKEQLNSDTLVLFVLTKNFYASPVCLCEMGAAWVQTKEHIPILVPPFSFEDIEGVIPFTEGFKINVASKLNLFKEKIETVFGVSGNLSPSAWERKRDRIVARIDGKIAAVS